MSRREIRIGGFGGQGVILSGLILGRAAAIYDGKETTLTRSYGPEARGGACSAQVVISEERVRYPYLVSSDALIVMSQEAYERYSDQVVSEGLLIVEEDLVHLDPQRHAGRKIFSIPATRIAEDLGRKIVLNIVMIGFFTAVSQMIPADAVRKAIADSVPKGTEDLNFRAFDKGYEYGMQNPA